MTEDARLRCACEHGAIYHHPERPFRCLFEGCKCEGYHAVDRRTPDRRRVSRGSRRIEDVIAADDGAPFTPPEVARISGFSESFIRLEMDAGEIPFTTFGRGRHRKRRLVSWRTLKAYLQKLHIIPTKTDAA